MAIARSGMEQSIERARVANALAQLGIAQIAVSDVERLVWAAEQTAELRRQLAEMTKMHDAAVRGVEIREEIFARKTAELRARLQAEKDTHQRTLSLQDDEVAEFNAGYEAAVNGVPLECEPDDLPFDVWTHGWKSADHKRLSAEVADLRQQLEVAQAEHDQTRAELSNARVLLGDPVGVDIAIMGLLAENADLRRQWAAAQTDRAEVLKAIDIVIAERDASHAEIDALRRQLAECQAAASPALIEEYAKACHYAGERNYAAPDFAVWLRRRLEAQVE